MALNAGEIRLTLCQSDFLTEFIFHVLGWPRYDNLSVGAFFLPLYRFFFIPLHSISMVLPHSSEIVKVSPRAGAESWHSLSFIVNP